MATATRSPLVEQAEKIDGLARHLSEGRLLEKPVRLAGSEMVWTGPIQLGFNGWLVQSLDFWVRNQLAEGLRLVARSLFDRAAAVEQAAAQMLATGQVTVAPPAMPAPLNYSPGTPPQYGDIGGGGTNTYNVPEMRNLSRLLLATADEVMNFARTLDLALQPPPAPPPPPGSPPPINPLPPDTEAVVGYPQTYLEIANQLRNAAMDVAKRADIVMANEEPLPTATNDLGIVDRAASGAAAQAIASDPAADQAADAAQRPAEKPPPTEEEIRVAREEGEKLAAKALHDKALEDPKELKEIAKELEAHRNDPAAGAYAAAFVKKFGPKNMLALPRAVHSFQTGVAREPKSAWEQATRPPPSATAEDKEDILYAFSATLATASHSDALDQRVEDQIFDTDDKLALAWLLANPNADFDADFLVRAFEAGVMEQIKNELALTGIGAYGGKAAGQLELNGTKLSDDTKIVVLEAISRNKEAAMRIADMDFKPPLKVAMGVRQPQDVHNVVDLLYLGAESNNGYSDNGAALGRMLDSAHQGFVEAGDTGNAKELVDRILGAATHDKDVKAAQESLRLIGLRQPVTDEEAEAARALVEKNSKHPARELLLGETANNLKASSQFVEDAVAGKKYAQKSLYETSGAWDVVRAALTAKDATDQQRENAERTLEVTMAAIAGGQELAGPAREGLAHALALRFGDMATILLSPAAAPEAHFLTVSDEEIRKTLAEVASDKQARETLMVGAGAWSSKIYTEMADKLASGQNDATVMKDYGRSMMATGEAFCHVVTAVKDAGIKEREEAMALLSRFRLGVDVVFDLAEMIPAVGKAKGAIDGAMGKIPGGLAPDYEEKMRQGLAQHLSGVDMGSVITRTKEDALGTVSQVDSIVLENMMGAIARKPAYMVSLGMNTWGSWPPFMLAEPPPPPEAPLTEPLEVSLRQHVKSEFFNSQGGLQLPVPGSQHYAEFQQWYSYDLKNPLCAQASFVTAEVRTQMNNCMARIQWEESL